MDASLWRECLCSDEIGQPRGEPGQRRPARADCSLDSRELLSKPGGRWLRLGWPGESRPPGRPRRAGEQADRRGIGADLDRIVDVCGPPRRGVEPAAALTRAPVNSIPSAASSQYRSLRTQPAAARWSRCPPVKSASTVTPPGVHRCGKGDVMDEGHARHRAVPRRAEGDWQALSAGPEPGRAYATRCTGRWKSSVRRTPPAAAFRNVISTG